MKSDHFIFEASMDIAADKEALFNEVYDLEHVPNLLKVPGVIAVTRAKAQDFSLNIGGAARQITVGDNPRYTAWYEIEGLQVLVSDAWAEAIEAGRWPNEVRPYTSNRRHILRKVMA